MAAAVSWSSAALPLRNIIKLSSWQYRRYECERRQANSIKGGNIGKIVLGIRRENSGFWKKQVICFATLEGKSHSEPNLDALEPDRLNLIAGDDSSRSSSILPTNKAEGKPGFVSFHGHTSQSLANTTGFDQSKETPKYFWYIGPTVLVSFLVFPSLYLRRVLSAVFEDSLLTDFLILFFTEALFYIGVAIFVLLVNHVWSPLKHITLKNPDFSKSQSGLRVSSVATLILSLIIPLVTMGMVWPWTGPAASATLAPYLVGLVVQFAFEQYARFKKSPAWPVIPIIFQVYRLHQLNRAAQLVTALSFSVRGAETTSQIQSPPLMSDQISPKRPAAMEELERVFSHYDADGDGKITGPELKTAVRALSPNSTSGEVGTMMDAMDANHDGVVDLKEFSAFLRSGDDRQLRDAFDLYDMDHNGLISAEELHLVLKQLGDRCSIKDCHRMIGSVDADGDGSVNFDEFKRMMGGGAPTPSDKSG